MKKRLLRCRCPLCGMMPYIEQIKKEVAEFKIYHQKIGGKVASGEYDKVKKGKTTHYFRKTEFETKFKPGRGKAKGYIEYIDISEQDKQLYLDMVKFLKEKVKRIKL